MLSPSVATGSDAIPSKVYRIMASARPLIAITDPHSDLAALVNEARCGVVIAPGDAHGLARVVAEAASNRAEWDEMGRRGRAHVAAHYSRNVVSGRYDALIRALMDGRR